MMSKRQYTAGLALLVLIIAACASTSGQFYDTGISDEEYIAIAGQTEEARAFLTRYPQAEIYVDRSGALAVDYRVTRQPVVNTAHEW